MAKGKRAGKKSTKKTLKRVTKKKSKPGKLAVQAPAKTKPKKPVPLETDLEMPLMVEPRGGTRSRIAIEKIDRETIIGDLIVVYPRTRDVLQKHGLRLDVEDAGDIYMNLEAFAALQGLKTVALIQELIDASKEPSQQPPQVPQLAAPPAV